MSDDLNCAIVKTNKSVYDLQFYCITEEVMLAEENKNSGRSPLDGKFTHSTRLQPITHVSIIITCYNGHR